MGIRKSKRNNYQFIDSSLLNDATFMDYLDRFEKIALSIFEWVNLPESMNAIWLEKCLYMDGQASLLYDKNYGFINTRCCTSGDINIYDLPTAFNCYSHSYQEQRKLYVPFKSTDEDFIENERNSSCILVQNNWNRVPTLRFYATICSSII